MRLTTLDAGTKFVYNGKVYTKVHNREKSGECVDEDGLRAVFPTMIIVEKYEESKHGKRRKKKVGGESNAGTDLPINTADLPIGSTDVTINGVDIVVGRESSPVVSPSGTSPSPSPSTS